jgi:hypothetical protein
MRVALVNRPRFVAGQFHALVVGEKNHAPASDLGYGQQRAELHSRETASNNILHSAIEAVMVLVLSGEIHLPNLFRPALALGSPQKANRKTLKSLFTTRNVMPTFSTTVQLSLNGTGTPISPLIYGVNNEYDPSRLKRLGATVPLLRKRARKPRATRRRR